MPTIFFIMQKLGVIRLPRLFRIGQYVIFFWSNENNEPIHVHISVSNPTPNATKVWLTKNSGCIVANNQNKIPQKDLTNLLRIIQAEFVFICNEWKVFFDTDTIKFYC